MAWVTGVMLLLLCFAVVLKYAADKPALETVVGPAHGFLYIVYVITTFQLAYQLRWRWGRTVLVMLAGTVPFMSFVAERKVVHDIEADQPAVATA